MSVAAGRWTRAAGRLARLAGPVLLLLLLACQTPAPRGPLPRLPADDGRPARFLEQHHALAAGRQALRARTRVRLEGRSGGRFARQLLLVERPDRLRVEVLGLAGQRIAALATDGRAYDVFRSETGRIESGLVHPDILLEFVGVPITPAEGAALLLGVPELVRADAIAGFDAGEGRVAVEWWEADQLHRVRFDDAGRLVSLRVETPLGGPSLEAAWSDYRDLGGTPFAYHVHVAIPPAEVAADVEYLEVELSPELAPGLFRLGTGRLSSPAGGH